MGAGQSNTNGSYDGSSDLREADLYEQVENLPKLLRQRQRQLDLKEKELERALKALEREKKALCGSADPDDIIRLNVGGTKIAVLRQTLTCIPGSMLASRFSGRFDATLVKDTQGNFFIEQPIHLFDPLINFLRAKRCHMPRSLPPVPPIFADSRDTDDFNRMVEYFGMTLGVYPVMISQVAGDTDKVKIADNLTVESTEWSSISVTALRHERVIESYEVTVLDAERIQIGWANPSQAALGDNGSGVGDAAGTIAIDFTRGGIISGGGFLAVEELGLKGTKTVVKSESYGAKWYVDDVLVVSIDRKEADSVKMPVDAEKMQPTISVKGSVQVTDIVYRN